MSSNAAFNRPSTQYIRYSFSVLRGGGVTQRNLHAGNNSTQVENHTVTQLHNLHAGNILSFHTAGTPFTMAVTLLGKKKIRVYAVSQCINMQSLNAVVRYQLNTVSNFSTFSNNMDWRRSQSLRVYDNGLVKHLNNACTQRIC